MTSRADLCPRSAGAPRVGAEPPNKTLRQTAAPPRVSRGSPSHGAAAAAELGRSAREGGCHRPAAELKDWSDVKEAP